jgi:hypothetical protein
MTAAESSRLRAFAFSVAALAVAVGSIPAAAAVVVRKRHYAPQTY